MNNRYRTDLVEAGMLMAGMSPDDQLVEIIELPEHPYFVASQFHPEFKSRPDTPHPLFVGFIEAAVALRRNRGAAVAPALSPLPDRA